MPSFNSSTACDDGLPRHTSTSGSTSSICRLMKGRQDLGFLRRRIAIAGRPPRNHVGDVGGGAIEADGTQHQVEQFAGTADERQAGEVFVAAGCFADEHHARFRIAVGEYQPCRGRLQCAAIEVVQQGAQFIERRRGSRCLARRCDGDVGSRWRYRRAARNRLLFHHQRLALDRCIHRPWSSRFRLRQPVDRFVVQRAIHPGFEIKRQQFACGRRSVGDGRVRGGHAAIYDGSDPGETPSVAFP